MRDLVRAVGVRDLVAGSGGVEFRRVYVGEGFC